MQNTARANQGSTLPFNKYRNFTIFLKSANATNFVVRFILWEPKIYCNIYFQSIKFGGSTNGCCFLFLVFFIAYSGDQNLYPTKIYTVRKSFREFKTCVYILEMLHKIFCKEGLYTFEILSAFRIYTVLKPMTINKVYRLG